MEREHIYNASNHDGTLNAVIRWNIGGVDLIVDGKRKANALHFHGYRSATLANQRELNQTVECLLSVLTADTLKDGLKWALSCFPWAREVQTIGKYKGETTNAEGTQIKWYAVFTEEKLTVSLSGANFKLINIRSSYTTPPTQQEMQGIITDVQQLLTLPLNEALQGIRQLLHNSEKYECFKRPEPQPKPKQDKPKREKPKPKREKAQPKPKQEKPKREKTEPRPKQEKTKRENTQAQMRKIMDEYFRENVGGGWRMFLRGIQRNGRKVYNVEIGFSLYFDDPDRIITVVCPTEIPDGTPQVTWEKDFRELLQRIANDFTGDITETLTNLEMIANENRRKKTNLQEFAEKLDEYNLKKYKKYATQVTWDEWEQRMMAEEQERKNNKKTTITTDGTEKERTENN